jgi:hypothetical protein
MKMKKKKDNFCMKSKDGSKLLAKLKTRAYAKLNEAYATLYAKGLHDMSRFWKTRRRHMLTLSSSSERRMHGPHQVA